MNSLLEIVNRLGPQRLVAMGAVTLALVGFFAFVMTKVTTPGMGVLFSDLSAQDSSVIIRDLETKGVKHELRQDGAVILVPRDVATRLRMEFAGKGLPAGGSVGYEIFDKSDNFSTTNFVQGINQVRALEGELARTIKGIDRVQQARVHLAIPEKKLFDREKQEVRASIVLKVRGELDIGQIRAIRHLVATAVQGLKPEHVSIVDEAGRLLADGAGNESDLTTLAEGKQTGFERRLKTQVEDIVSSVVGRGRARVQVAAEMDFNRVQQVTDTFDPEGRVVRSTQTRTENQQSQETRDKEVSVAKELPQAAAAQNNAGQKEATQRNEEVTNFEISKTTRTEVIEAGRVKRLSVAVLIDGTYSPGANGQMEYKPRNQEEIDRITALVRSSIGFDRNRGDQIEVVNLRFAEGGQNVDLKPQSLVEQLLSVTKEDILRGIELGIFAILTLLVVLLVVRPLMKQMGIGITESGVLGALAAPGGGERLEALTSQGSSSLALPAPDGKMSLTDANLSGASTIQASVQNGVVESFGKVVNENQTESIAILKSWIAQGKL